MMRLLLLFCLLLQPVVVPALDRAALETQRGPLRAALERIERGAALDTALRQQFADHPLLPWLEYAELRHDLERATPARVAAFSRRHSDLPFVEPLRLRFLHELARRKDWKTYLQRFRADRDSDDALRCHALTAHLATGTWDASLRQQAVALWRHGESRPEACDPVFAALERQGGIDDALRWQRIELAAAAGNTGLMRFVARGLPKAQQTLAEQYAAFVAQPSAAASSWPRDARSRQIASIGLARLAHRDPAAGTRLLGTLAGLGLDESERGAVLYQAALWSAASYLPDTAQRMAAVPASAFDERLHEWRAREALARSDIGATLAAIAAMPTSQRADGRWRYLEARMRELDGDAATAKSLFATLAGEPNYHGFLAADRIGAPYALCPSEIDPATPAASTLEADPALVRALELHAIDRRGWAELEWKSLLAGLDDGQRRLAVAIAVRERWFDRAVFALAGADDQTYYSLRFGVSYKTTLRREARKHGLDESWVAALIRAESAWQPDARSHADARGLMQLLPATAAATARAQGLAWSGGRSLYDARTNIALGTAYLARMLARHGGKPYLATAAYNAGPAPIGRWLAQRPAHDVDLWIETIPYRETREYVGRIMAFSVVYDWRLHGDALPLSARMRGESAARRPFACPAPTPIQSTSP